MDPTESNNPASPSGKTPQDGTVTLPSNQRVTSAELTELLKQGKVQEFNERRGVGPYLFKGLSLEAVDLQGVVLDSCIFENCNFRLCSFTKSSFRGSRFMTCQISACNFEGIDGTATRFDQCSLSQTSLRNAELGMTAFIGGTLRWAYFSGSSMKAGAFDRVDLFCCEFEKVNAQGLLIAQSRLRDTVFAEANLKGSKFIQTNSSGVNFRGANLVGFSCPSSWWEGSFVAEEAFISKGTFASSMFEKALWAGGAVLENAKLNKNPADGAYESLRPEVVTVKELIDGMPNTDKKLYDSALARLSDLIGLAEVKSEVEELAAVLRTNRQREQMGLTAHTGMLHYVFAGPPGTGKTTVARILGDVLKSLGYLSKGHFVETDRAGLVGRFLGETAVKTKAVVEQALGGVLFIDEAYSLTPANEQDSYAQEAVSTLLKIMEDKRDNLVVIAAGYDGEMERFVNYNPGLQSRFANRMKFRSLDSKSSAEVFEGLLKSSSLFTDAETKAGACQMLAMLREKQGDQFGNARAVRNIFEKMVRRQSARLVREGGPPDKTRFNTLTFEDLPTKEFLNITVDRFRQMVDKDSELPFEADLGVFIDPKIGFKGYHFPN